jgi:acyl carrier protein
MVTVDDVLQIVYEAIKETNALLPRERRLELAPDTVLFAKSGKLDSLGLVNLVVAVEERVERRLHRVISLADLVATATGDEATPFYSVRTLSEHLLQQLKGDGKTSP